MSNIQYILIDTGSESNRINMSDVGKMENAIQISKTHLHVNKVIDYLIRVHFSYKLACKINIPGKKIWSRFCVLKEMTADSEKEYYIVIVNNAIHRLSVDYLNQLSRKQNIHIFLLLLDPFKYLPEPVRKMISATHFENIYTFQKSDCEKYGFEYSNQIYSKIQLKELRSQEKESDVYYIGAEKGRMNDIYALYKYLSDKGMACDFTVVVDKKKIRRYHKKYPGVVFTASRIGYGEILKKIDKTKCIIELCQEGQDGCTMRFYEALFYNKLLITNNVHAEMHQYFNSEYMQVFRNVEDIDVKRLKSGKNVDYKYMNELSPANFMKGLSVREKTLSVRGEDL